MDWLIAACLWLVPPFALACCYRPLWRAHRLSPRTRNALAVGITAALVVLVGLDAIGFWRLGPFAAQPRPDWYLRIALVTVTAATFAFPTGWALAIIWLHWRRPSAPDEGSPFADPLLMAAWAVLVCLVLAYAWGLGVVLDLTRQRGGSLFPDDLRKTAPIP
jgi:hypothetical protein